jgi:hypothetical protein
MNGGHTTQPFGSPRDGGLGAAVGEDAENMLCALSDRKARNFAQDVAARSVPLREPRVDVDGFSE